MKVLIERTGEKKTVNAKTARDLLDKLRLNPAAVLVIANGNAITEDTELNPKDEIVIMSVVSGG